VRFFSSAGAFFPRWSGLLAQDNRRERRPEGQALVWAFVARQKEE